MADLNAYLNFNVQLDKSVDVPVIRLADISAYTSGVSAGITSRSFTITQPDGVVITGTSSTTELRLASDGNFQKGLYVFVFTVTHPDYTGANTITRSYYLDYSQPKINIAKSFDEFAPSLNVFDRTDYSQTGFSYPSISKSWAASFGTSTITGSGLSFDLISGGNYYNSLYQVTLVSSLVYTPSGAGWFSVKDKVTVYTTYKPLVPASLSQLYNDLGNYQANIKDDCCSTDRYSRSDYTYAFTLFQHLIMRGKCGSMIDLRKYIEQIQKILFGSVPAISYTGDIINEYSFDNFCGVACGCDESTLIITDQPDNTSVNEGSTAAFSATASGGIVPYSYQWQKDESNISGATASTLTIQNTTDANEGSYRLRVTDASGKVVFTEPATLTVNSISALSISVQPQSQSISEGSNVTFNVTAAGGITPYTYQWRKDGSPISGATSSSYSITGVVSGSAGSYDVVVGHAGSGTVTSSAASLTVASAIVVTTGYSVSDPYVDNSTAPTISNQNTFNIGNGANIYFSLPAGAADKFWVVKVPISQPVATGWYHNTDNSGAIPGDVVRTWAVGSFRYYASVTEFVLTYTDSIQLTH